MRERLSETQVRFKRLSADEIAAYLAGGEWHGKAGGYAIQGAAEGLIAWIARQPFGRGRPAALRNPRAAQGGGLRDLAELAGRGGDRRASRGPVRRRRRSVAARLAGRAGSRPGRSPTRCWSPAPPARPAARALRRRRGGAGRSPAARRQRRREPCGSRSPAPRIARAGRAASCAQARPTDRTAPRPPRRSPMRCERPRGRIAASPSRDGTSSGPRPGTARSPFAGGSLTIAPTPAMTLIDIDGTLAPARSRAGRGRAGGRGDRRGSTSAARSASISRRLPAKADRRRSMRRWPRRSPDWPHERTAMNGFGFVQLVARLERPSLLHRSPATAPPPPPACCCAGPSGLTEPARCCSPRHPAVRAASTPEWERELARRTGREVRWHERPALALEARHAQVVPR